MATPDLAYAIGLKPEEAIRYFEGKGYAIGFKWEDVWQEAHARAFTVAGVMKVDVLQDIRNALGKSVESGGTLAQFQKELMPVLERKGWLGRGHLVDDQTGEIQGKRLTPRRLETIFRTNMQSAYMAGRFATQLENVDERPWWEYVAVMDNRTRPAHRVLNGRVYRYDDPFWRTFYPPNGYRCRCRVRTRSRSDMKQLDLPESSSAGQLTEVDQVINREGETRPTIGYRDPVTGKTFTADPGFGFNAGQAWAAPFTPPPQSSLIRSVPAGAPTMPAPVATPIRADRVIQAGQAPEQYAAAFLERFGTTPGAAISFEDAAGARLAISDGLFASPPPEWAWGQRYAGLLADAVRTPDEIWLSWERFEGAWQLMRRYVKTYQVDGGDWMAAGFEYSQAGWSYRVAAVRSPSEADELRALDSMRGSFLLYRKGQP